MGFPTVEEVRNDLWVEREYLRRHFGHENEPDEDGEYPEELSYCGDTRLQVTEEGWCVHVGLSDYDQDHRGYWGASSITHYMTEEELHDVAVDLIDQAKDSYATR